MSVPLLADPRVPPLEPHYRLPIEPRHRRDINKSALAWLVDARLLWRARLEARLDRARSAVARRLIDRRAWEPAGYSNPRDYAREELGLSLRTWQDLARLDRALCALPRFDVAVRLGRLAPSRVLQVLPVVTPESEALWLREAQRNTVTRLAEVVGVARAQGHGKGGGKEPGKEPSRPEAQEQLSGVSGTGIDDDDDDAVDADAADDPADPMATLRLRQPARSRKLWEAFVDEASRVAGRPLSDGDALELLLAEFRPLLPEAAVAAARGHAQALAAPRIEEDEDGEWVLDPGGGRADGPDAEKWDTPDARSEAASADGCGAPACGHRTDDLRTPPGPRTAFELRRAPGQWRHELIAILERDPQRATELRRIDQRAADEALQLLRRDASYFREPGDDTSWFDGHWRRGVAHDVDWPDDDLDNLTTTQLQQRFLDLRRRLRRLAVEQGALLYLMRNFTLYRAFRCAGFGHYTKDRLGLGRRTADQRADFHRAFTWEPALREAWTNDEISDSYLPSLQRLVRRGLRQGRLRPWVDRARRVNASTFRDQVRWYEARREGWFQAPVRPDPRTGTMRKRGCPELPPTFREWCAVRAEWNRRPDLLVWLSCGWQISARGGIVAPDGTGREDRIGPLAPTPAEPATVPRHIRAPQSVIRSFLETVEVIRGMLEPALPPWWCLEYMILHVRRDWARESDWAAKRTEGYEILERDGFRCTSPGCRSSRNLQVHHIRYRSRGGDDRPKNLTTLCAACHQFALHQAGTLAVRGHAPHRLVWRMGRQAYVGEFRR
jgi:hypothetical protein